MYLLKSPSVNRPRFDLSARCIQETETWPVSTLDTVATAAKGIERDRKHGDGGATAGRKHAGRYLPRFPWRGAVASASIGSRYASNFRAGCSRERGSPGSPVNRGEADQIAENM